MEHSRYQIAEESRYISMCGRYFGHNPDTGGIYIYWNERIWYTNDEGWSFQLMGVTQSFISQVRDGLISCIPNYTYRGV